MDAVGYYSSIAPSYDALYKEEQLDKIRSMLSAVKPKKNWIVLDIGAGTGLLEENLKVRTVTAIEPSEMGEFLETKKLPGVKVEKVKISQFKSSKKFDAVFCITVLQDLDKNEREKCIKSAFEHCKRGGKVVISVLKQSNIDLSYLKPSLVYEVVNDVIYIFNR
ncbi:MAG: class I SAM-dependent methyltransferase [Candidatus Parvarchaeota archaeon]|nr:class I SAM-dependent methyltransferase [Candidatus Parvarchaeota archaeon]MCL5101402.1 class I SAM-dependent methyltransferase [Candidatus Parvarchaeota archaeon]